MVGGIGWHRADRALEIISGPRISPAIRSSVRDHPTRAVSAATTHPSSAAHCSCGIAKTTSTTRGSNCLPASRRTSSSASGTGRAAR